MLNEGRCQSICFSPRATRNTPFSVIQYWILNVIPYNLSKIRPWAMNELKCMAPHKRGVGIFQELWYYDEILPPHTLQSGPVYVWFLNAFFVVFFWVCVCVFLFCFLSCTCLCSTANFVDYAVHRHFVLGVDTVALHECCGDNKWWFPFLQDKMASKAAPKKNRSRGEKL